MRVQYSIRVWKLVTPLIFVLIINVNDFLMRRYSIFSLEASVEWSDSNDCGVLFVICEDWIKSEVLSLSKCKNTVKWRPPPPPPTWFNWVRGDHSCCMISSVCGMGVTVHVFVPNRSVQGPGFSPHCESKWIHKKIYIQNKNNRPIGYAYAA